MARKSKATTKRKGVRRALNAFQEAERLEAGKEGASDSEAEEGDVRNGILNARKLIEGDEKDDEDIEDEDIESDEAFGSEDDFEDFKSNKKLQGKDSEKKRKHKKGNTLSESEAYSEDEGYKSIDENDLVSLSQAWDMDDENLKSYNESKSKNEIRLDDNADEENSENESEEEAESDSVSEESDSSEEEDIFKVNSDEEEENDLSNVKSVLKAQQGETKNHKKLINETRPENAFAVPSGGSGLSIADMMSAVDADTQKDAILIDKEKAEDKSQTLSVPLPKRIQERNDRSVAYGFAKEEVSKFEDTVQQLRQAEVLKFPINPKPEHNDSAATFRSSAQPTTDFETKIHDLLKTSKLDDDKKEATFEEIQAAKLSPEEVKKRTNELRLMRELMFREEKRNKRVKKIKSKTYRRIRKKEKIRNQQMVEGSDYESDKEDHDLKRAEERMSLKHKSQTPWAQSMINSGMSKDANARAELEEMARKSEKLRAKQLGGSNGDSEENLSDIEKEYARDELLVEDDNSKGKKLGKGILDMDFMKQADKRNKEKNLREIEDMRNFQNDGGLEEFKQNASAVNISKNQGRRVYTPSSSSSKQDSNKVNEEILQEIEDDEADNLTSKLTQKFDTYDKNGEPEGHKYDVNKKQSNNDDVGSLSSKPQVSEHRKQETVEKTQMPENPWLSNMGYVKQNSKNVSTIDRKSSKDSKAAAKLSKNKKRSQSQRDDEDSVINLNDTIDVKDALDSEGSDAEEGAHQFRQKDLIREAFAGDDVVSEFEKEKRNVVEDEDDKEEDGVLPGWGNWAGTKKPKKQKFTRKVDGVAQKDKRKDKNMPKVIINEKVNKKNLKYQSSGVPYPYESREQYEMALRVPIGQEWTSKEMHQKLTMPRVIVKQGTAVDPLKAPFT